MNIQVYFFQVIHILLKHEFFCKFSFFTLMCFVFTHLILDFIKIILDKYEVFIAPFLFMTLILNYVFYFCLLFYVSNFTLIFSQKFTLGWSFCIFYFNSILTLKILLLLFFIYLLLIFNLSVKLNILLFILRIVLLLLFLYILFCYLQVLFSIKIAIIS